jgi:hypothetical protein
MFTQREHKTTDAVDDLIETYVAWREECSRVRTSYGRWAFAARAERTLAFAAYLAALDGEDRAAGVYRGLVERTAGSPGAWSADEDGLVQSW